MGACRQPCKTCPWSIENSQVYGPEARDYVKGGAFSTEQMLGQAVGPFWLPCHMGYRDAESKAEVIAKVDEIPQCAGAANFRANMGLDNLPYELGLLKGEKDETVFSDPIEFTAYHKQIPHNMAYFYVTGGIVAWRDKELLDREGKILKTKP